MDLESEINFKHKQLHEFKTGMFSKEASLLC